MHGNARKPAPDRDVLITYRCGHRSNHSSEACQNREIKRDVIEGFVLTQLERYFFNDDIIPTLTKELNSYINTCDVENDRLNTCLTERHSELERQKANIIDAIKKTGFQDIFSGSFPALNRN